MTLLRLTCSAFWVNLRLLEIDGRWIASADTPDGPSLGLGEGALEAIEQALEPFEGMLEELLASMPGSCARPSRPVGAGMARLPSGSVPMLLRVDY